ncbi:SHOCT domain-containing protein [Candidatus Pelagibacter bacterium nBUS_36]|uniref:SHOCT domain-containing protein n=1 Tax=Candidatus Pelagibacter bacterium nBUS_36 TaxID=3374194 RepID=UPI003EB6F985
MKKFLFIIFFTLIFSNFSFSKSINVGLHNLDVPNKFVVINWSEYSLYAIDEHCGEYEGCYSFVSPKVKEVVEQLNDGKSIDQIAILKPIIKKINKLESTNYNNFGRAVDSLFSSIRSILKKNNSETMLSYLIFGDTEEVLDKNNFGISADELRNMSNKDINFYTNEIKKELNISNNYLEISPEMGIKIKSLKFSISSNKTPYLFFHGDFIFLAAEKKIKATEYIIYLSEKNNKLFGFDGYCFANCSKFKSSFNSIIKNSFKQNNVIKNVTNISDNDVVDQLEQLNNLFKSGVLTKEEFEKAKKKILN